MNLRVWLYWQGLQSHTQNCVCVPLIKRTYLKYVKTIKMILFRFKKNIYRNVSIYTHDRIVLFCFVCKMIMREFKNNFPLSTILFEVFNQLKLLLLHTVLILISGKNKVGTSKNNDGISTYADVSDLLLWSVFANRRELAEICWLRGKDHLCKLLCV